jgi:hypothetical protein
VKKFTIYLKLKYNRNKFLKNIINEKNKTKSSNFLERAQTKMNDNYVGQTVELTRTDGKLVYFN